MKNTYSQLVSFISRIDYRIVRAVYFLFVLGAAVFIDAPSDGGVGPY